MDKKIEELLKIPLVGGDIQELADGIKRLLLEQKLSDATALKKYYTQLISEAEIKARISELEDLPEWGDHNSSYRQEIRYRLHTLKQGKGKE